MKATEFCYWLQGFFEINGVPADGLTQTQTQMVQKHLHLVFKHEIDPSYPDKAALDAIHNPQPYAPILTRPPLDHLENPSIGDVQIRC